MNKKTNKAHVLKKEHFEILLEDINDKLNVITEGYTLLNNKIDTKIDHLTNELHSTRDELIFLIKASVEHSEERLKKEIRDGDKTVIAHLEKKIEDGDKAVIAHVDQKINEINIRFDRTDQKLDEINNSMKTHADKLDDHEERLSRLEHKN